MAGNVTTLPITLDQMIYHAKSVVRGVKRAMVVVDMPFGSYQGNEMEGLASAIRIMKESHADALKLEGGEEIIDTVKRIVCAGIPVMGHLGLMPQSINKIRNLYRTCQRRSRSRQTDSRRPFIGRSRLFCHCTRKNPRYPCRACSFRTHYSYHRNRCRRPRRRSGIGYSGHAWHEQRIPSAFLTSLC